MKRVILQSPATFVESALTEQQADAIRAVHGQWVAPMPGSVAVGGDHLIDAVVDDSFDPDNIAALELPFVVLAIWQWDGASPTLIEVQALDEPAFLGFLPLVGGAPPELHEPHQWAGWPSAI